MHIDPSALAASTLIAAALNGMGHYLPLRPPMRPPKTYIFGVGTCLLADTVYGALTGSLSIPLPVTVANFAAAGLLVILFYRMDHGRTERDRLEDLEAENVELRRRLAAHEHTTTAG